MKKVLVLLFFFFLIIVVVEGVYYFYFQQKPTPKETIPSLIKKTLPSTSPTAKNIKYKILYQAPGDKMGRTILYQSSNPKKYSGSGIKLGYFTGLYLINPKSEGRPFFAKKSEVKNYPSSKFEVIDLTDQPVTLTVIGLFKKWETIKSSKDRLVVLIDPLKKNPLPKGRVAFEKSDLFGKNPTWINLENMKIKDHFEKPKVIEEVIKLTPSQVDKLIKKGDALVIHFSHNENFSNKRDKNNNLLIESITIRRFGDNLEL